MSKTAWYWNRLRAMSMREIIWRLKQHRLQQREMKLFRGKSPVVAPLYPDTEQIAKQAAKRLGSTECFDHFANGVVALCPSGSTSTEISLLGPYRYKEYATHWHAGFNTPAEWPLIPSYQLKYKQRDDIGDARINWELNRHRQFQRLALSAYLSSSPRHNKGRCTRSVSDNLCPLRRLEFLLDDWVEANPFLWGISWTSPMEIALRSISWTTTARLLSGAKPCSEQARETSERIRKQLLTGVANMTEYLLAHASGFSSANNHLIIEMTAVAIAGLLFDKEHWRERALMILDRELFRQTTPDGVDRESSLHYHAFVLEAYLLVAHEMHAVGRKVPITWKERLAKMTNFVRASMVNSHTFCTFGDDDEARIIDLVPSNYYKYLLDFHRVVFPGYYEEPEKELRVSSFLAGSNLEPFLSTDPGEQSAATAVAAEIMGVSTQQEPEEPEEHKSVTFPEGGYTFLRSKRMFVGIDHAPLGFGAIAAHGHCDALSFQLYLDEKPIFVDAGTYLYHIDAERRNFLRSSMMHNTVTINNLDQSEMLGAFLFGKKADAQLLSYDQDHVEACVKGLSGVTHTRHISLAGNDEVHITDRFDRSCSWTATFILAPNLSAKINNQTVDIYSGDAKILTLTTSDGSINSNKVEISPAYGKLTPTTALRIVGNSRKNFVTLRP